MSFAQTTIISEDFESYTAGQGIAQAAGAPWTTWSGTTGGSEDPDVTTAMAHGGSQSIYVIANNDCVVNFGDLTTGRYQIQFYIYVVTGKVAYFNLLSDFAGSSSEWATQAFFNIDGTGTVDANGESAGTFTFNHAEWIHVNYIIDLDDDFATLYINGNEVTSWQYTKGSFGSGCEKKLDAINIYGWSDDLGNASTFYVDDFSFIEQVSYDAPLNLVATVTGSDIGTTWEAPASGTPDSYLLMSNGNVVASGINDLFYDQTNLYPGTYAYTVRAHFDGLGYSPSSNESSGTVEGGVDRNLVLFEINTGTWCGYCPGAAMGADDLIENGHDVAIIEYHNGDPYATADCATREIYYTVEGFPTTTVDGISGFSGGNATTSLYDSYVPLYDARVGVPSLHITDLVIVQTGATTYEATLDIEQTNSYFTDGLVLRAALTETHIPEVWLSGLTEINFVCRQMFPDANGTTLDYSGSATSTHTFTFDIGTYVKDNCEFIVFIQHDPTKEVVQTAKIDLETIVGINELSETKIAFYPNPAKDYINIFSNGKGKVEIVNISGQVVLTEEISVSTQKINLNKLESGIYMVNIITPEKTVNSKLIIE